MNNTVSCGRRILIGDKQNCDKQKRILYNKIITKIQDTRDKITGEENSSLNDKEVEDIKKILDEAEKHFVSKLLSHA